MNAFTGIVLRFENISAEQFATAIALKEHEGLVLMQTWEDRRTEVVPPQPARGLAFLTPKYVPYQTVVITRFALFWPPQSILELADHVRGRFPELPSPDSDGPKKPPRKRARRRPASTQSTVINNVSGTVVVDQR